MEDDKRAELRCSSRDGFLTSPRVSLLTQRACKRVLHTVKLPNVDSNVDSNYRTFLRFHAVSYDLLRIGPKRE
jgi:hypothetical protein